MDNKPIDWASVSELIESMYKSKSLTVSVTDNENKDKTLTVTVPEKYIKGVLENLPFFDADVKTK